jgi:hypothetical protein
VLLRPLPLGGRSDRVVTLHSVYEQQVRALGGVSYPDLVDLQARVRSLDGIAGLVRVNFTLSTEREADRLVGCYVTPELFRLLDVAPALGRHFMADEAAPPGLETTVLLTYGLWQSRFGGDPSIVGRAVTINDRPHTVVGVMPPGFRFPDRAELYLPLRLKVEQVERSARTFTAIGVLKPDVTRSRKWTRSRPRWRENTRTRTAAMASRFCPSATRRCRVTRVRSRPRSWARSPSCS